MQSLYNVPIVPLNLRKEETIIQIAEVVDYLSKVVDDVVNRVNNRIDQNTKQLNDIANRIDAASNKVSQLTGAKKATQVFSSCKYPAANVNRQYISVFNINEGQRLSITRNPVKCASTTPVDETLETLQFYHVKIKQTSNKLKTNGLGKTPKDVVSLNEVLLYNTGKNVYSKYEMSDTLVVSQQEPKNEYEAHLDIGAAPLSISDRINSSKSVLDSFSYAPNLGDVPTIDVPLDLPDLPGIADDMRFTTHSDSTIAPSVATTPNIPDLPPITDLPIENVEPPPLELPLPPIEPEESTPEEIIKQEAPVVIEERSQPAVPDQTDAHASLMEAIRKAGGSKKANLKTAESKNVEETPDKKVPVNDLMKDLYAKLAMRRKGISGSKTESSVEVDGKSAMDKISAMIPPPPADNGRGSSTNTEDEDWEE